MKLLPNEICFNTLDANKLSGKYLKTNIEALMTSLKRKGPDLRPFIIALVTVSAYRAALRKLLSIVPGIIV